MEVQGEVVDEHVFKLSSALVVVEFNLHGTTLPWSVRWTGVNYWAWP